MKRFRTCCSRHGLLAKTAIASTVLAVIVGLLSIIVTIAVTHERQNRAVAVALGELLDTVQSTLEIACLTQDRVLAAEVVNGMLKNSDVLGVVIRTGDQELAHRYRTAARSDATLIQVREVKSPYNSQQTIGEVLLEPDPASISRQAWREAGFVGILLGLQWLVLGGCLLVLVLLYVVRPIKTISDHLHHLRADANERLQIPAGQEHTEIGRLVNDINSMATRLVSAIDGLSEQTCQLQEAKDQVDRQAGQLEAKNVALARAMQVRDEVERIARHDLKTPLGCIASVPELLRRGRILTKDEETLLSIVETSAKRALHIISLSLHLFRMEDGKYVFTPKALDLVGIVREVALELNEEAQARDVRFALAGPTGPVYANAEEVLCYSIVSNLMKNALEAAPVGSVVSVLLESTSGSIHLDIHNEGAVPPAIRASFFEKYCTAGKARGTGLGTYSARLMARIQQGELSMETSEEHGTTLRLELPLVTDPEHARAPDGHDLLAEQAAGGPLPKMLILLVDDDPSNSVSPIATQPMRRERLIDRFASSTPY